MRFSAGWFGVLVAFAYATSALAAPKRVLLTGFEKFGGSSDNSSRVMLEALMKDLGKNPIPDTDVHRIILPVVWGKAEARLRAEVQMSRPELVISFGEAGTAGFSLERTAWNRDDGYTPDNDGKYSSGVIIEGAPDGIPSKLPLDAIAQSLEQGGFPHSFSDSAGGFLCNHIFFHLMSLATTDGGPQRAGFVHVPMLGFTQHSSYSELAAWGAPALRRIVETAVQQP
jgi:pyroglutamyl-peptidase